MQSFLTTSSLLTATAALMAFQISLYTLVARERKAPYVINSVFWLFLLCLTAVAFDIAGALLPQPWQDWALLGGGWLLLCAVFCTAHLVYRTAIRFVYFIDDPHPKHWPGIRHFRAWRHRSRVEPTYSHNTLPITSELKDEIAKALDEFAGGQREDREELGERSLAVAVEHQGQGNRLLAQLALIFIKRGNSVQYLTASRHPIEFIDLLREEIKRSGEDMLTRAKQIVVIDAYTPHFGFIDSIYRVRNRQLDALGVTCIKSKRTFAGMHTASSRAFNRIKAQRKQDQRLPTLVIYEDCYALTDLESPEQYRVFVRHVLPSERMWDGMFTVFLESAQADAEWRLLQSYASIKLDLRKKKDGAAEIEPLE
jgi:hypothetical protein